jgi:hypothetical protein
MGLGTSPFKTIRSFLALGFGAGTDDSKAFVYGVAGYERHLIR